MHSTSDSQKGVQSYYISMSPFEIEKLIAKNNLNVYICILKNNFSITKNSHEFIIKV